MEIQDSGCLEVDGDEIPAFIIIAEEGEELEQLQPKLVENKMSNTDHVVLDFGVDGVMLDVDFSRTFLNKAIDTEKLLLVIRTRKHGNVPYDLETVRELRDDDDLSADVFELSNDTTDWLKRIREEIEKVDA